MVSTDVPKMGMTGLIFVVPGKVTGKKVNYLSAVVRRGNVRPAER